MCIRDRGTSATDIDHAEDRHKFSAMLDEIGVDQPRWRELTTMDDIYRFVDEVGFPVLIRPSYVLSGAAMNVVSNRSELEHFLTLATNVSKQYPVVVTEFIENAKEIEIDAVARGGEVLIYAISEHVEFAGVHSGDATMVFPPQKMYVETMRRIKKIAREVARMLNISGPFNMQLMAKDNEIKVIECNLRASRSFPFVSKVLKVNFIDIATKIMLGIEPDVPHKSAFELDYVGIKAPQFSFSRLQKADPVLGVEMASTGEVGCIGENFHEAILKSMMSVGYAIPKKNILLSTGDSRSKMDMLSAAKALQEKGYNIFATKGTAQFLETNGVHATVLHWPDQSEQPNTLTYIKEKKIDLVVNIPKNLSKTELNNDYTIRRSAIDFNIPLITNARLASAFITAFCKLDKQDIKIKSWNEYKRPETGTNENARQKTVAHSHAYNIINSGLRRLEPCRRTAESKASENKGELLRSVARHLSVTLQHGFRRQAGNASSAIRKQRKGFRLYSGIPSYSLPLAAPRYPNRPPAFSWQARKKNTANRYLCRTIA